MGKYPSHESAYRKKKYMTDHAYRNRARQRTRDRYRADNVVYMPDAEGGLRVVREGRGGAVRTIMVGGKKRRCMTYTVGEISGLIGRTQENIMRWFDRDILPMPRYRTTTGVEVYLKDEVVAILGVLATHFTKTAYYRYDHFDTRAAIFSAVHEIRKGKGHGKEAN